MVTDQTVEQTASRRVSRSGGAVLRLELGAAVASAALVTPVLRLELRKIGVELPVLGQRPPGELGLRLRVQAANRLIEVQVRRERVPLRGGGDDGAQFGLRHSGPLASQQVG